MSTIRSNQVGHDDHIDERVVANAFLVKKVKTHAAIDAKQSGREAFALDMAENLLYMTPIMDSPSLIHTHAKIILGGGIITNASQKKPRFIFANLYPESAQSSISEYWYTLQVAIDNQWTPDKFTETLMRVPISQFPTVFPLNAENPVRDKQVRNAFIAAADDGISVCLSRKGEFNGFEDISEPTQCLIIPDGDRRFRIVLNPPAEHA